ncbi:MAG: hypothetical protein LBK41_00400 [Clostridiales bacterium]|jgi:hypothetical protein|nr:hypothetical protein [Clostridiales bacterium]
MVNYVSELRPGLLDDLCGRMYMMVAIIRQTDLKRLVIGGGSDFSHVSRFVIDLSALKNTTDEVIEAVASFRSMYPDARVVVIADKEPPESPLFARLFSLGVYDVVTDLGDGGLKKCLTTGFSKEEASAYRIEKPDLTDKPKEEKPAPPTAEPEPPPREKITANRDFRKHRPFVTVAVCATEPHMGATHQSLLIAKFLSSVGFKACYLEANKRRNILYLARTYPVNANERKHLLQFECVDMYFDFKMSEVIASGYDFYVFDLGRFAEAEAASFLTKDVKIIVGGAKAWEMPAYTAVFDAVDKCRDVHFILNHAPPSEARSIRELMGGLRTYFAEYVPYPFAGGVNLEMYKNIFQDFLTVDKIPAIKSPTRTNFWKRG